MGQYLATQEEEVGVPRVLLVPQVVHLGLLGPQEGEVEHLVVADS